MLRLPPRSTRTDTLFPYTTLFRSIPELGVKRILALGNLMPRIRILYRDGEIDATTVRHLTMASKSQQRAWLALHDDPDAYVPTGTYEGAIDEEIGRASCRERVCQSV